MSALADAAADYLRLRNRLGHELAEYHRLLPRSWRSSMMPARRR
jgi:integrase/recombinase XerD